MNFINISRSDFLPDKKLKMGVSVFLSILGLFLYQWTNFWEQIANFELPLLEYYSNYGLWAQLFTSLMISIEASINESPTLFYVLM